MKRKIELIINRHSFQRIEIFDEYFYSGWVFCPRNEIKLKIFGFERTTKIYDEHWMINGDIYKTWKDFADSSKSKHNSYWTSEMCLTPDECIYGHRDNKVYLRARAIISVKGQTYVKYFDSKSEAEKWAKDLVEQQGLKDGVIFIF